MEIDHKSTSTTMVHHVPAAGATEICLALFCREFAAKAKYGRESSRGPSEGGMLALAANAMANGLSKIPRQLIRSAMPRASSRVLFGFERPLWEAGGALGVRLEGAGGLGYQEPVKVGVIQALSLSVEMVNQVLICCGVLFRVDDSLVFARAVKT
eukprot:316815-Amorphochlora_amoeboformis.AAC.1